MGPAGSIIQSILQIFPDAKIAAGQEFYVSSSGSGTGTGAIDDPFTGLQLLNLINSGLPGVPPGSTIRLNKGETFNYQFNLISSDINFDSYGSGAQPIIDGSDYIGDQSWTDDGSSIYYTTVATQPKWVYVSGQQVPMAESDWIQIKGRSTQLHIEALSSVLDPLNAVESLVGAYLLAKEWEFRPCLLVSVTAYSTGSPNGSLTLNSIPNTDATGAATGMPFKLLNKKSFITDVGEWTYDSATQRLYIKTSGISPSGTDIRITTRDYGINLSSGVDNVTVNDIKFQHQFLEGFYSFNNDYVSVTGCTLSDIRTNAISFTGNGTNITFTGNSVTRIGNNGVHIGGINVGVFNNNTFSHIGDQVGVSIPIYDYFKSVGCAIHMRWDDTATVYVPQNITAQHNIIDDVGYCSIVYVGYPHDVRFNEIDTCCLKWTDGAGIYISNVYGEIYGHGSDTRDGIVSNNSIKNCVGGPSTMEGLSGNPFVNGIYTDNNCSAITIEHNYVENVNDFCYLCNWGNKNHIIRYNQFIAPAAYGVGFRRYSTYPATGNKWPAADGHIFTNNVIACRDGNAICLYLKSYDSASYNPFANGGACDNNTYWNPYRGNLFRIYITSDIDYSFTSWKAIFSLDGNSITDVTKRLFISSAQALVDILSAFNNTDTPTNLDTSSHYYLNNGSNTNVTSVPLAAYSGNVVVRDYSPDGSLVVEDTYSGSAVNLPSHTPDVGVAWTVNTGTHATNGSGLLTSSVAGYFYQVGAGKNATIETIAQVTGSGSINITFRYNTSTDRILVQLVQSTSKIFVINDATTIVDKTAGITISTNTFYTLKARLVDGNIAVWLNGTVIAELFNNATLAASNVGIFNHGLFNPTVGQQTQTKIWNQ